MPTSLWRIPNAFVKDAHLLVKDPHLIVEGRNQKSYRQGAHQIKADLWVVQRVVVAFVQSLPAPTPMRRKKNEERALPICFFQAGGRGGKRLYTGYHD